MSAVGIVLAVLGSGTSSAIVVAVLQRRRTGAEARKLLAQGGEAEAHGAAIIVEAAKALLQPTTDRINDLQAEVIELRARQDKYELAARRHQDWDRKAVAELHRAGISLPPPPPLIDFA